MSDNNNGIAKMFTNNWCSFSDTSIFYNNKIKKIYVLRELRKLSK